MEKLISFVNRVISYSKRRILYFCSLLLRCFIPIKKKQVLFWADSFYHYGCNPKYISEYLANNDNKYSLIWAFKKGVDASNVKDARVVRYGTIEYLFAINSSEFIITNQRISSAYVLWKKKKGQKYIMTWHGSCPLKMIMADANKSKKFKKLMLLDSAMCDLILSDSDYFTNIVRRSFWYDGEILQKGLPRNDIFFDSNRRREAKEKICRLFGIDILKPIVLYAPTFRDDEECFPYITKWTELKNALNTKFQDDVQIIVRLHPNMINSKPERELLRDESVINATKYDDMQELLCAADLLITDYSSCMFEISMLRKPCFLYTPDINTYERDFYLPLSNLPFRIANTLQDLIENIIIADFTELTRMQERYLINQFNVVKETNASGAVLDWMNSCALR